MMALSSSSKFLGSILESFSTVFSRGVVEDYCGILSTELHVVDLYSPDCKDVLPT